MHRIIGSLAALPLPQRCFTMRSALSVRVGLVLSLLVLATAGVAQAQQSACTYETCALRLRYRGLGDRRIVAGAADTPVDRGGFWSRKATVLETGSDSVRFHYVEYRSHASRAGWLAILGATAVSVAVSMDYEDNKAATISVYGAGVIISAIAGVNKSRSEDHLQRAIWLYNRDLAR